MEQRIVAHLRRGARAARGPGARLAPRRDRRRAARASSSCAPSSSCSARLFERAGMRARDLRHRASSSGRRAASRCAASPLDLVYLRDTDLRSRRRARARCARPTSRARSCVTPVAARAPPARQQAPARALLVAPRRSRALGVARRGRGAPRARSSPRRARSPSSASRRAWRSAARVGVQAGGGLRRAAPSTAATRSRAASSRRSRAAGGFVAQRRVEPGVVAVETRRGPARA